MNYKSVLIFNRITFDRVCLLCVLLFLYLDINFIAFYVQRVTNVLFNVFGSEGVDVMTEGFCFPLLSDDDIPPHPISHPL